MLRRWTHQEEVPMTEAPTKFEPIIDLFSLSKLNPTKRRPAFFDLWQVEDRLKRMKPGHTTKLQDHLIDFGSGDLNARDEIITHTCERLRMRTRQMLRSFPSVSRWSQTDDVLQNAMLRLHRSLTQVKPESPRQFYGLGGDSNSTRTNWFGKAF